MKKKEIFIFKGIVLKILPDSKFIVKLNNGHELIAYSSGKLKKNHIRILNGDLVKIEISKYNLNKGRIIYRL